MDRVRLAVEQRDVDDVGRECLMNLFSGQLNQGVEIQLRNECPADRVHRSEFGGVLVGLSQ